MENKERELGYYWVTLGKEDRIIAEWNGNSWWITGVDRCYFEEEHITDINENRIVEEDAGNR